MLAAKIGSIRTYLKKKCYLFILHKSHSFPCCFLTVLISSTEQGGRRINYCGELELFELEPVKGGAEEEIEEPSMN